MKKELKISTLSIVCVLCTAAMMPAFGASSVRSLGGSGTYTGTASAAAAKSNGATTTRNSSVRATAGATKKASTTSGANSSRAATTSRLSIGKYLGGSTAISGGSSVRPGGGTSGSESGADADLMADLQRDVDQIRRDVDKLHDTDDEIKGAIDGKQDSLTASDGKIIIDDTNNISLDMAALEADLALLFGVKMELRFEGDVIQYKYETDASWTDLVDMKSYATSDALVELEDRLNDIVVPTKMSDLENDTGYITADDLPTDLADIANIKNDVQTLQAGMELKADADDVNELSSDLTTLTATVQTNAGNIATLTTEKADQSDLDAAIAALNEAIESKQAAGEYATAAALSDLATEVEKLKGESASDAVVADLTARIATIESTYATDAEVAAAIAAIDLSVYAKTADLGELAYKDTVEAGEITSIDGSKIIANTITDAQIADGSISATKLNTSEMAAGEMAMLIANGDGTGTWVSVDVVE
ncbi:MAG: hypothetical protein IJX89_01290 [Alphaproteobacteria bacterium]|nr:hypothetical protein [Alphaproteobacteria bacterium]